MKKGVIVLVALLFFSLVGFVDAQQYYDDYSDVLLVCNANSSVSQEICSYFIQQRTGLDFNSSHVVNLTNVSTAETINESEFEKIYTQVNSWLGNNSNQEINYIVTTSGVPLRTSNRSVDSKLMARLGATNNYYSSEDVFTHSIYGGYLITRLTGYNAADAKRLIDNSDNASITGNFLLNKYSAGYSFYDMGTTNAYNLLTAKGYSAELNNSIFVRNRNNLSGYWSWGSNAGCGINCRNSSAWNLSFNPGAIGETAVSTSAWTFGIYPWNGSGPYGGQSLILDLIHYNITGIRGYVYEPYLAAVVMADGLFDRYTEGYNLADTYYMSSYSRDWMDVVVGDPKTHVVESSNSIAPVISLRDLLDGERINNGTNITFAIYLSKFYDLDSLWYSMDSDPTNTTISTTSYTIDTSSWSYGDHTITVYANDSHGSESSKTFSFTINTTIGETPEYSYFNGNSTTNIKVLADKTNVSGLTLEKEMAGRIDFLSNLSVSGLDLNSLVQFSDGRKVSINSSAAPSLNVPANITLYNSPGGSYANQVILRDGQICNRTTSPACYNFTALNASEVKFNVSSWSTYEISGNFLTECVNLTQAGEYLLRNNITNRVGTCFNVSANNVTLNLNGFVLDGDNAGSADYGVYARDVTNFSLTNGTIREFGVKTPSPSGYGVYLYNLTNSSFDNLNISSNGGGVYAKRVNYSSFNNFTLFSNGYSFDVSDYSSYNTFLDFNLSTCSSWTCSGISFSQSSNNSLTNFNVSDFNNEGSGVYCYESNSLNITGLNSYSNTLGLEINLCSHLSIFDSSVYNNQRGVWFNVDISNFLLNNLNSSNNSEYTLRTGSEGYGVFEYSNSYSAVVFSNLAFFNESVLLQGDLSFPGNINLSSNYIYVNSTALPELNGSANLTLYFSPNEFSIPYIAKDSVACADCFNFTSLTSDTVEFNVSSFSAYSLMENDTTRPNLTYISNSVTNQSINVSFNVSDDGRLNNCTLTVGALSNSTSNFSNPNSLFVSGLNADRTYTATLSCYDYADNINSTNISFTTDANPVAEQTSSGSGIYYKDLGNLENGFYDGSLSFGSFLRFNVSNESHKLGIANINRTFQKVKFNVYSEKQEVLLGIGETKQLDLNADGKNDVVLTLKSIDSKLPKTYILLEKIEEKKIEEKEETSFIENFEKLTNEIKKTDKTWVGIVIVLVIIFGVVGNILWKKKYKDLYKERQLSRRVRYHDKY
jgi:uncharacterized protein (TIGR03790 family)